MDEPNLPFVLQDGETLQMDAPSMAYYGTQSISYSAGLVNTGLPFVNIGTSNTKLEGVESTAFKNCHAYLTNNRIIFCHSTNDVYSLANILQEKSVGDIFSDIPLEKIEGIHPLTKQKNAWIEFSVRTPSSEITKNAIRFYELAGGFWRAKNEEKRVAERDSWIKNITNLREKRMNYLLKRKESIKEKSNDNPINLLKLRFAKGEITKEQFEEMKMVLES